MTKRAYYTDAYTTDFHAMVEEVRAVDGGSALVLDTTYFYPTSGGQQHDVGTLSGLPVVDVAVADDGEILHVLDRPVRDNAAGQAVHGLIDWERRYDHMQQHSGQHLLSATFTALFGLETVSVHFGAVDSTLDLDTSELDDAVIAEAERFANTMVFSNLPIRAYFVDEAGLARLPLRRPPKVTGQIRIVEIEKFDYSACGGTHVRWTGEIGPVKVVKTERRKDQTRVTFLCGWRAVRDYAAKHALLMQAANLFSNEYSQVPELIARLQEQNKQVQRELDARNRQLLTYAADALLAGGTQIGDVNAIAHLFTDKDAGEVRHMAAHVQAQPGQVALLASTHGGKVAAVFARSEGVDLHAGNLLRDALKQYGGGGGGRPDLAQGGGINPDDAQAMLDFALAQVKATLT
ncbi:MAG: alanyl-tRNA editing protein [Caldilineaceae bacterium]|nr:alanyl-tRNA editing protein [Caldilineaceae bacterium]